MEFTGKYQHLYMICFKDESERMREVIAHVELSVRMSFGEVFDSTQDFVDEVHLAIGRKAGRSGGDIESLATMFSGL